MSEQNGFDPAATQRWVGGVLVDPGGTARAYAAEHPGWQRTFLQIVLPVHVAALLASLVLAWLFDTSNMYAAAGGPTMIVFSLLWALAGSFVVAFVFDFFAGVFKGQRRFDAAFAALALAFVPAAIGGILGAVPWIGWLISLAAAIYGLVLAYRFVGIFMTVPEDKRVVHFVVSLVVMFVISVVVSTVMVGLFGPDFDEYAPADPVSGSTTGGLWGGLERQADFAEQAAQDVYDPPADGRVSDEQITAYIRTLERTAALRERLGRQFEEMGESSEEDEPSIGDIFGAVSGAARMGTAEMEVVKTAGGNWAEHQWVRNQLEVARVQQDGSPAIEHNYALFLEHEEAIAQYE